MVVTLVLVPLVFGCQAMTGKTAGQNIDDAGITTAVKSKLAAENVATLTRISVNTEQGTVYLTGVVENEAMRQRASQVAGQVGGVRQVVNNLKVQTPG
jgi:osmotically-inducible protein OsmY